jgi:trigger factor
MKVTVKEEPAWRRVLDIEVDAQVVEKELDRVVEEYRRRLTLPGFRKGKVPVDMARRHMGEDLEGEVLRRLLPQAFEEAVRDKALKTIGDPRLSNLRFHPGEPLTFTATVEVVPEVEITGYEGLTMVREQPEVEDEDIHGVLDRLRERHADLAEVDRPAQGGDVVSIRYFEVKEGVPAAENEPRELDLTLGEPETPESFTRDLLGAVVGDMKRIPLAYPPDYDDAELAGTTRTFHVTVAKIQEKIWPAADDAFAKKILESEESTLEDLRSRIRLNLEVEARMRSMRAFEDRLIDRILELNPYEVPKGVVEATLDRIAEEARKERPNLPPDEEMRLREEFRPGVERRYRTDILIETVGHKEGIEVTDEDLDREIGTFAQQEGKPAPQVKADLKRNGNLERLRHDLFRRRVIDRLMEKADVTVTKVSRRQAEGNV